MEMCSECIPKFVPCVEFIFVYTIIPVYLDYGGKYNHLFHGMFRKRVGDCSGWNRAGHENSDELLPG